MDERICPKCKKTIKEGNVYCEHCGYDIPMVPDFDARIETELDDAIAKMLEGINLEEMSEEDFENLTGTLDLETTMDLRRRYNKAKTKDLAKKPEAPGRKIERHADPEEGRSWIVPLLLIVLAVMLIFVFEHFDGAPDVDGLIKKGRVLDEKGEYEKAMVKYNAAMDADPSNDEAVSALAEDYYRLGDSIAAQELLLAQIAVNPTDRLYDTLIRMYESEGSYQAIGTLLEGCEDPSLRETYVMYVADPPSFDTEEGSYEGELSVGLVSSMAGEMYYTLDGSEPDENSTRYTGTIELENGKNVIRAVLINPQGIKSQSVSGIFELDMSLPEDPVVTPEAGNYVKAEYIRVEHPEELTVYYTDDDTMPDENSKVYEQPLLMKQGENSYRFVAYDKSGRRSNITSVKYTLNLTVMCSEADAVNYVKASLTLTGRIRDALGTGANGERYSYKCIGMLTEGAFSYYVIEEDVDSGEGIKPTGDYYTVETTVGLLGRASRKDDGTFAVSAF